MILGLEVRMEGRKGTEEMVDQNILLTRSHHFEIHTHTHTHTYIYTYSYTHLRKQDWQLGQLVGDGVRERRIIPAVGVTHEYQTIFNVH